jgi:LCP family protein required for cell wall assembly
MSRKSFLWCISLATIIIMIGSSACEKIPVISEPLAPTLEVELPSATPRPINEPTPTQMPPTQTTQPTCGETGVMTILYLARDTVHSEWPYGVDLIRYIRIDFDNKKVAMVSIPRDLWISTPHLATLGIEHSRLGLVYYYLEQATTGDQKLIAKTATDAVAQALFDNYGVPPTKFIYFDMKDFAYVIDALGGIDINIPYDIALNPYSFKAGQQHLDGQNALIYARLLPSNSTEWERFQRQNIIIKALLAKVILPANILQIPGIYEQLKNDIVTDLSPVQILNLICMIGEVPQDQITMSQVGPDMVTGVGPDNSLLPNIEAIKLFLAQQLNP